MTGIEQVAAIWTDEFGAAFYLPAFSGKQLAAARARVLTLLHGATIKPVNAGTTKFRTDLYVAAGVDSNQCYAAMQDEFEAKFRPMVEAFK